MGTRGFASFRNKVRSTGRQLKRAEKTIPRRSAQLAVRNIKANLIRSDLVATTELWRSVKTRRIADNAAAVLVSAPYAGFVERGTGAKGDGTYKSAKHVPFAAILAWMEAKPTFVLQTDRNPVVVAMIIADELEDEGQRQQPFFEPAWDETVAFTKRSMELELKKAF